MENFKRLRLLRRNYCWLASPIALKYKVAFYPSAVLAMLRGCISENNMRLYYLGTLFYYDNYYTPLSIQTYPHDINQILSNIDINLKRILDIGGNIGQFSLTLHKRVPDATIDVFEPNPVIFPILKKNTLNTNNIRIFNFGIGYKQNIKLNFQEGKSATGSVYQQNASKAIDKQSVIDISLIDNVSQITKVKNYDLIKIDVEGYEYEVIKNLVGIKTRFMFIEISGLSRYKDYNHSSIFKLIAQKFGTFDIAFQSKASKSDKTIELLINFY